MEQNELYHYGVLGMKWGRRKARTSNSRKKSNKAHTQDRINEYRKREEAKVRIADAGGSKKKAVKKINTTSTIKQTAKKGALATASVINGLYSMGAAVGATKMATGAVGAAYVTGILGSFAATPVTALGFGAAALATAAAAGGTKLHQRSKSDQEKIDYIKKSK